MKYLLKCPFEPCYSVTVVSMGSYSRVLAIIWLALVVRRKVVNAFFVSEF
jgi:hypothetical protein